MSAPLCRCRVLYLGSADPGAQKDGLQGVQEPLFELYPQSGAGYATGIDAWLSVWNNGLLLEYIGNYHSQPVKFFPIETLHYCAGVRLVYIPAYTGGKIPRFLPLDSPYAVVPNVNHPPLFACMMQRTVGAKYLECHAYICKNETAANALVKCSFHAFTSTMYMGAMETFYPLHESHSHHTIERVPSMEKHRPSSCREKSISNHSDVYLSPHYEVYERRNDSDWDIYKPPVYHSRPLLPEEFRKSTNEVRRSNSRSSSFSFLQRRHSTNSGKSGFFSSLTNSKGSIGSSKGGLFGSIGSSKGGLFSSWGSSKGGFFKKYLSKSENNIYKQTPRPVTPTSRVNEYNDDIYFMERQSDNTKEKKKKKSKFKNYSPSFSSGIFKQTSHLNEKAFSHSIQQERQSWSKSTSNLNDDLIERHGRLKKDKEMASLLRGLNLNDVEPEREFLYRYKNEVDYLP